MAGLYAVSTAPGGTAWAVGYTCTASCGTAAEVDAAVILHWNGTAWTRTASPPGNDRLTSVAVGSEGAAWAVGISCSARCGATGAVVQSLILHWDGTGWRAAGTPVPGAVLASVAVGPAGTAWAVGAECVSLCGTSGAGVRTLTLYWNGTAWSQQASPSPGTTVTFTGVAAGPGATAWAVGYACTPNCSAFVDVRTLIAQWNGSGWSEVGSPGPGQTESVGSGPSGDWVAGEVCATGCGTTAQAGRTLLMRWTGTSWSTVPSPTPYPIFALTSVGADLAGPPGAWAVGYACTASCGTASQVNRPLILHWTGTKWLVSSR